MATGTVNTGSVNFGETSLTKFKQETGSFTVAGSATVFSWGAQLIGNQVTLSLNLDVATASGTLFASPAAELSVDFHPVKLAVNLVTGGGDIKVVVTSAGVIQLESAPASVIGPGALYTISYNVGI